MKRRIFSLLLCICLIFSIMPIPSHAEETALEKMLAGMEYLQQERNKRLKQDSSAEDTGENGEPDDSVQNEETEDLSEDGKTDDPVEDEKADVPAEEVTADAPAENEQMEAPADEPEEPAGDTVVTESVTLEIPVEDSFQSGEDLLAQYVDQQMRDLGFSWFASDYGDTQMPDERNLQVYWALKQGIRTVAANGGSTVFQITLEEPITVTYSSGTSAEAIGTLVGRAFENAVQTGLILDCLLADCPYELYWFDKVTGFQATYTYSLSNTMATVTETKFTFAVASEYRGGSASIVKAPSASADVVATARENALAVVAANEGKTDLGKLTAYKDYICGAVEYNYAAISNSSTPYGNPWQLVWVFDGDSSTNVVCEGYSKAFQYLCELSDFTDSYFASYLMTGDTGGGHMWNLVTLDDVNYLVDVTNTDVNPQIVSDLFMNAQPLSGDQEGFTISFGGSSLTYQYDAATTGLYPEEIRKLGQREHTYANGSSTCSVCGRKQVTTHTHSWSADWNGDANGHWHSCSGCEEKGSYTIHTAPADDGNCTTAVTCPTCGYVFTPAKSHSFTNACDATCNNAGCSHTRTIAHNYEQKHSDDTHWMECSVCQDKKGETGHSYGSWTANQNSTHAKSCSCGHSVTESCYGTDDNNCSTALSCEACGYVITAAGEHSYTADSGTRYSAPTCEEDQKNLAQCANCGAVSMTQTVTVPGTKLGHAYGAPSYTWSNDNTTCTAQRICGNDAAHKQTETVSSTAAITQSQSCTAPELTKYTAQFQNAAFQTQVKTGVQTKAASGHSLTRTAAREATCMAAGNREYWSCSSCGKFFSDAAGTVTMQKDSWITPKDSSKHTGTAPWIQTETTHKKVYNCCGAEVSAETGHTWTDSICSVCGYGCKHTGGEATCTSQAVCTICGNPYGDLKSHSLKKTNAVAATCMAEGNRAYWTCSGCGKFFSDAAGKVAIEKDSWITQADETNHNYADTLTQGENTHYYACTLCGSRKEEADHSYGSWKINQNGTHTKSCICGHKVTETCTGGHKCTVCGGNISSCTGGTATCTHQAVCELCGLPYGGLDSGNHASDALVCTDNKDGKTHRVKYSCCHAVKNAAQAHSYEDGLCSCGALEPETPDHSGRESIAVAVKKQVTATQNGLTKALTNADIHIADEAVVSVSISTKMRVTRDRSVGGWFYSGWRKITYDHTIRFRGLSAGTTTVQVGDVFYQVVVTGTCSHSWVQTSRQEPACTTEGQIAYLCSNCGSTKSQTIPATGHSYKGGVCAACGKTQAQQTFTPRIFRATISKSQVNPGASVTITVRTSADVAYITVNGQKVTAYTTQGSASSYRIFTWKVAEDTPGQYAYQIEAYNAKDIRSGTSQTLNLVVEKQTTSWWMPWMSYFYSGSR